MRKFYQIEHMLSGNHKQDEDKKKLKNVKLPNRFSYYHNFSFFSFILMRINVHDFDFPILLSRLLSILLN